MSTDDSLPDFSQALTHYFAGDRCAAMATLTSLSAKHPDNASVFILLGNLHYSRGSLEEALKSYRKATELAPKNGHAYYKLGVCAFRAGLLNEAREAFVRNLALQDQSHAMSHYWIGLIDYFLGKDEQALASFRRLKEKSPESNFANFFMALLLIKHKRHKEALDLLDELLGFTPDFTEALYLRGQAFRGMYKNFEAMQCFRRALEFAPDDARIRMELETLTEVPSI